MFPPHTHIVGCGHEITLPPPTPAPAPAGPTVVEGCGHLIMLDAEAGYVGNTDGLVSSY